MSIDLKYTAQIERPLEIVCAAVTDLPRMPEWFSVKEIRNISDGPLSVGTRFQLVKEIMGTERVIDYTVTAYEPCEKFAYRSFSPITSRVTMTLTPQESGTRLTFELSVKLNALLASAVKGSIRKETQEDLARLVASIEAGG